MLYQSKPAGTCRRLLSAFLAASMTLAAIAPANARIIKESSYSRTHFMRSNGFVPIDLGSSSPTTVVVVAPASGRYALTYSAVCSVSSGRDDHNGYVDINIVVNNRVVPSTLREDDGFCSSNGTSGITEGFARASMTIGVPLNKGRNYVKVYATLQAQATVVYLGHSLLVVDD